MRFNIKGRRENNGMKVLVAAVCLFIISTLTVSSQDDRRARRNRVGSAETTAIKADALPATVDSIRNVVSGNSPAPDSVSVSNPLPNDSASVSKKDSVPPVNKSSIDMPAFSAAKDSIIEDFSDGKRMIYYYGDVSVTYGNMKLSADYMEYDLLTGTVYARGTTDTAGVVTGMPQMEDGGKTYTMEEVRYNFNTRKARINDMITQEQDGILHGKNIKMMPDQSINITHGKYTVCDCEHPHYYLNLTSAKVMTKPSTGYGTSLDSTCFVHRSISSPNWLGWQLRRGTVSKPSFASSIWRRMPLPPPASTSSVPWSFVMAKQVL